MTLLCNWTTTPLLNELWGKMIPPDLPVELVTHDPNVWVIVNAPPPDACFVPARTIIVQMEPFMTPWMAQQRFDDYLAAWVHARVPNCVEWHLGFDVFAPLDHAKTKTLSTVLSSKYVDPGHKLRVDFVRAMDRSDIQIDVYGTYAFPHKVYKGPLPYHRKDLGMLPYKYHFNAENHSLRNYVTEKLTDALLCECLCFYWGCPNVAEIVDPDAYVLLDLNDVPGSLAVVRDALATDLWAQRLPAIRRAKQALLHERNTFARVLVLAQSRGIDKEDYIDI